MAADDDRVRPSRDQPRHVRHDDRLAEDDAAEDVADRSVGRLPHLLEVEFLHPRFVGRDGRAFDADAMLLDCLGRLDGDPVVGLVALFDAQIVIEQLDVEIGLDQPFPNPLPDDSSHFVAVELDDGVLHLDLGHVSPALPGLAARIGEPPDPKQPAPERNRARL